MQRLYAEGTSVPIERSQGEVTRLIEKIGADSIVHGREGTRYVFAFRLGPRQYRYTVDVDPDDPKESRRRWRVLVLRIKCRVSLILEAGETLEAAFMPHQMLPDGSTVEEAIGHQLAEGQAPRLLAFGAAQCPS